MKLTRDLLKTVGAILVIGIIIVATFLYGNRQRQEQVRRDQQIRQQQEQKAAEETGPKVTVNNTKDNTVVKPENATNVGGGSLQNPPAPASGATPQTGSDGLYLLPLAVMVGLVQWNRVAKRNLREAALRV